MCGKVESEGILTAESNMCSLGDSRDGNCLDQDRGEMRGRGIGGRGIEGKVAFLFILTVHDTLGEGQYVAENNRTEGRADGLQEKCSS